MKGVESIFLMAIKNERPKRWIAQIIYYTMDENAYKLMLLPNDTVAL